MDVLYILNCNPWKYTKKFCPTFSNGTTYHTQCVQKNTRPNNISSPILTQNNSHHLTGSCTYVRFSVNNFRGSCCKGLVMSHVVPSDFRKIKAALYFIIASTVQKGHCLISDYPEVFRVSVHVSVNIDLLMCCSRFLRNRYAPIISLFLSHSTALLPHSRQHHYIAEEPANLS